MTNIETLITDLSKDINATKSNRSPARKACLLIFVIAIYGLVVGFLLGLRPDIITQFARSFFALEIFLMFLLLITSVVASVISMYPDSYQKPTFLKLPYIVFIFLVVFVLYQIAMPVNELMVMPIIDHGIKCALCIAAISIVPSAIIFAVLRKGASVHQLESGVFAVLSASAVGCITLRLSESNDSLIHLVSWHYLPTFIFASIGAVLGKWLLRW